MLWWMVAAATAGELWVAPFLQDATPTSVWVAWESDAEGTPTVAWGPGAELGRTATGTSVDSVDGGRIHHVQLTGLTAATRYHYEVCAGDACSGVLALVTPPDPGGDAPTRILAMSDMQRSSADPDKFHEIVSEGVVPWMTAQWGADPAEALGMVLIPGDLVDNGLNHDEWADTFFGPLAPLSAHVPVYPVLGNHENDSHWYYDYFRLPGDGTGRADQWWSTTRGNVLVVGLDSNDAFAWAEQLVWLEDRLDAACADDTIDFVFAQLHHPHHSEVWIPGNLPFTGEVIARLEDFTTTCGRPSVHFFGHTHAYSRGQSAEHRHLMVNVASAGGAIDRWGEHAQRDYPEFTVSDDDWGFVAVEVTAGDDPTLHLRRISRGDRDVVLDNVLTDAVTLRRHDRPPDPPRGLAPRGEVDGTCVTMLIDPMVDDEDAPAQAVQWQVAPTCAELATPTLDVWRQDVNRFGGVDTRRSSLIVTESVRALPAGDWCWRARYRDQGLSWGGWSEPAAFSTTTPTRSANLLAHGSAEDGLDGWTVDQGVVEVTMDGRCGAAVPVHGARAFALGGLCAPDGPATLTTEVAVPQSARGLGDHVHLEGVVWGGPVDVRVELVDAGGAVFATHDAVWGSDGGASEPQTVRLVGAMDDEPRVVRLSLTADTAQIDALDLSVGDGTAELDCAPVLPVTADPPDEAPVDAACTGCRTGGGAGWLALLTVAGLVRRRAC